MGSEAGEPGGSWGTREDMVLMMDNGATDQLFNFQRGNFSTNNVQLATDQRATETTIDGGQRSSDQQSGSDKEVITYRGNDSR